MNNPKNSALDKSQARNRIPWLSLILAAGWFLALAMVTHNAGAADVSIAVGPGTESAPAVAAHPASGRFLVVWSDTSPTTEIASGSFERIMGHWVDSKGRLQGNALLISQRASLSAALGGSRPAVAYNSVRNEFLAVYERSYDGSTENGIFAQRIASDGTLIGNELTVIAAPSQGIPQLAYDSRSDRYLVVWTAPAGLFGTLMSGDGLTVDPVMPYGYAGSTRPALAFSPNSNSYLLAYETSTSTAAGVVGVTIRSDGAALRGPFAIGSGTARQALPSIAWDSALNRFLVVWADSRDSGTVPAAYAQLVAENGDLIGANLKLAGATLLPRVIFAAAKQRFLLTWQAGDSGSAKFGHILGRIFRPDLTASGARFAISAAQAVGRAFPAADPFSETGFAAWMGSAPSGASAIFGQVLTIADAAPKMAMDMTAEPVAAKLGDAIAYTLRIANNGRAAAKSTVLRDRLPAGLRYVSATAGQGRCALRGSTVRCALGTIGIGDRLNVTLSTVARNLGRITNTAALTWNAGDSAVASKSAKATITARYPGELALLAPQGGETIPAGAGYPINWRVTGANPADQLTFRLQYSLNNGGTWSKIGEGITGETYTWQVVAPRRNRTAMVRAVGFVNGRPFGSAKSRPFRIEVPG